MKNRVIILMLLLASFVGCKTQDVSNVSAKSDDEITFKFIQLNDVYEIAPLNGGKYGGMARVAHIRDSIKEVNPLTYMFMAGDFLNPSLVGTLKVDGSRVRGKQMIEVMNAMNFDLVAFGNHEFDLSENDLQKRLNESNFQWMSSNVRHQTENGPVPFTTQRSIGNVPIKDTHIFNLVDGDGTRARVGFLGTTINSNPQNYVHYGDIYGEAKRAYQTLVPEVDLIMGLTHLTIAQDVKLADQLPKLSFVMGGHEHNTMLVPTKNAMVAKADANAKTIYIHTFTYNTKSKNLQIDSRLMPIDETVKSEPNVQAIVEKWNKILDAKIKEVVSSPDEIIYYADPPLDGSDSANRGVQTNLGAIITRAMAASFEDTLDAALVNGGSIRLDDMLSGDVVSLDIFRVLPFGGGILKVDITGQLLKEVLDFGKSKRGTGAYLQRDQIEESSNGGWLVGGDNLDLTKTYRVAFSDYLLKGLDIPFLTPENSGVLSVYTPAKTEAAYDIRKAIILYLKKLK